MATPNARARKVTRARRSTGMVLEPDDEVAALSLNNSTPERQILSIATPPTSSASFRRLSVISGLSRKRRPSVETMNNETRRQAANNKNPKLKRNVIRTSKYTLLTFLPLNLYEQFRRAANSFFVLMNILQFFPDFQTMNPFLASLPLLFILSATALKDGVEDLQRHFQDNKENNRITSALEQEKIEGAIVKLLKSIFPCSRPRPPPDANLESKKLTKWMPRAWRDLRVGDIVLLLNNESIPADCVVLSTSETDSACYVETKSMDGETNLKVRRACEITAWLRSAEDCSMLSAVLDVEAPSPALQQFGGKLSVLSNGREIESRIKITSLLLRGCILRNTEWVIAIVAYAGEETKLSLNSGRMPFKRTRIEQMMNPQVILNFLLLFAIVLVCGVTFLLYYFAYRNEPATYLFENSAESDESPFWEAIKTMFYVLIYFQNLIPISLFVTLESIKSIQAYFIHCDEEMYDEVTRRSCEVHSWNLSDDLGQLEYIFSDKTGTLTDNIMCLRQCSIAGIAYGEEFATASETEREKIWDDYKTRVNDTDRLFVKRNTELPYIFDEALISLLSDSGPESTEARNFFLFLSLCHTVIADPSAEPESQNALPKYKAQSPDEAALVSAAKCLGAVFLDRNTNRITVNFFGTLRRFKVLDIVEFDSSRKRMSILVQEYVGSSNKIEGSEDVLLICKGADSVIYERLAQESNKFGETTFRHLEEFASQGLRTLCVGYRWITYSEYREWAASRKLLELESDESSREEKIANHIEELESRLTLAGATAIEDRLQVGVPETIRDILLAGIKLWVLTGDKLETAISIGFSCNLLDDETDLLIVQGKTRLSTETQLRVSLEKFDESAATESGHRFALIIDGDSLQHALEPDLKYMFLEVGYRCVSVICCRASPLQKAKVVSLVQKELDSMCLGIGDGANDVGMIREARIGIGITGLEGNQAAMASDYAIGQFHHLRRLLFVHGRWNYRRIALAVIASYYKNIIFVLSMFWYQFFCGFTGYSIFDFSYINYYNLVFTAIPVVFFGIFDQHLSARATMRLPQIYNAGMRGEFYSNTRFWIAILDALLQSVVVFFTGYLVYNDSIASATGRPFDGLAIGTPVALGCITVSTFYVCMMVRNWTVVMILGFSFGFLNFPIFVAVYSTLTDSPIEYQHSELLTTASFWLCIMIMVIASLAPHLIVEYWMSNYHPGDETIIRELKIKDAPYTQNQNESLNEEQIYDEQTGENRGMESIRSCLRPFVLAIDKVKTKMRKGERAFRNEITNKRTRMPSRTPRLTYLSTLRKKSHTGFAFSGESGMRAFLLRRRGENTPASSKRHSMSQT